MPLKDDPLKAFYEQDSYIEKNSESKKVGNKSFEDVVKYIKDDYKEETPLKKRGKPNTSMKDFSVVINLIYLRTLLISQA
jgi:hypothetical protein